jgi:hypothetical protein
MRGSVIWKYGNGRLEVSISDDQVALIAYYPARGDDIASIVILDDLPAGMTSSAQLFIDWLEQEGVRFDVWADDRIYAVRVQGRVVTAFEEGDWIASRRAEVSRAMRVSRNRTARRLVLCRRIDHERVPI